MELLAKIFGVQKYIVIHFMSTLILSIALWVDV